MKNSRQRLQSDPAGRARFGALLAATPLAWLGLFLAVPLLVLLAWSFQEPGMSYHLGSRFTLESLRINLGTAAYWLLLGKTVLTALAVALAAVILAYPIAYVLAFQAVRRRYFLLALAFVPYLTSYLLRIFAWRVLLGDRGVLNYLLQTLGIIDHPIRAFLFNRLAVIIVLIYVWVPWAALPIFVRLEQVDRRLLEAASDLGAPPWRGFLKVTLPLSMPGIYTAFFLVFIPTLGDFAAASYVGGTGGIMLGNIINQFLELTLDFSSGAVLSMLMLAVAALTTLLAVRVMRIRNLTDVQL